MQSTKGITRVASCLLHHCPSQAEAHIDCKPGHVKPRGRCHCIIALVQTVVLQQDFGRRQLQSLFCTFPCVFTSCGHGSNLKTPCLTLDNTASPAAPLPSFSLARPGERASVILSLGISHTHFEVESSSLRARTLLLLGMLSILPPRMLLQ